MGATAGLPSSEISGFSCCTAGQAGSGAPVRQAVGGALRRIRRIAARTLPADTGRGRRARWLARRIKNVARLRRREEQGTNLSKILRENADRKGIVISPPFIDWTWMRQRPHQLMAQFARAGYLSLYCSSRKWTDSFRGFCPRCPAAVSMRIRRPGAGHSRSDPAVRLDGPPGYRPAVSAAFRNLRLSGQPERVVRGGQAQPTQTRHAPHAGR